MALAIFDLDHTLLNGDSDVAWGHYLVEVGAVDGQRYREKHDQYYQQYLDGSLDIFDFLGFALEPLTQHPLEQLLTWRTDFIEQKVQPMVTQKAWDLLAQHRSRGDHLLIITATNAFVTHPIAELLGVDSLIATDPEQIDGRYTGRVSGTPSFREGKVERLQSWLEANPFALKESYFYSDSHNDIPLLEEVGKPVAVNADPRLQAYALNKKWPQISLLDS